MDTLADLGAAMDVVLTNLNRTRMRLLMWGGRESKIKLTP